VGGGGGAFGDIVKEIVDIGCDVFITGNTMFANEIYPPEKGLTIIVLEETSSERWGVYAIGEHLEQEFPEIEAVRIEERNW
jgi:putative NIF3 family GTP cyclohydrolase 1 type 2